MKIRKKIMSIMAAVVMSIMMVFSAVAATGDGQLDFNQLKATVTVTGSNFTDESFGLVLKSVDNAPMPSGAENGLKTYSTGALNTNNRSETIAFGSIIYETPGVYQYTLTQNAGSTSRMSYDSTTYHIYVKVYNTDDKSGLRLEAMWVSKNDSTEKLDSIVFENTKSSSSGGSSGGGSGGGGSGKSDWHSVDPTDSVKPSESVNQTDNANPTDSANQTDNANGTNNGNPADRETDEAGNVLGGRRDAFGRLIDGPEGQTLGAKKKKGVQTDDNSMMAVMGCGFLACAAAMFVWERRIFHKEKSGTAPGASDA